MAVLTVLAIIAAALVALASIVWVVGTPAGRWAGLLLIVCVVAAGIRLI